MYCRTCGNQVDPSIEECNICGSKVNEGNNYCPHCGHFCIPGDTVCIQCKKSLIDNDEQTAVDSEQVPPIPNITTETNIGSQSAVPPPMPSALQQNSSTSQTVTSQEPLAKGGPKFLSSDKKYCRNCGLVISKDAHVCPFCEAHDGNSYCPRCGTLTIQSDTVCSVCSQPLTPVATTYIPSPPPVNVTQNTNKTAPNNSVPNSSQSVPYNVNIQNNYINNNKVRPGEEGDKSFTTTLLFSLLAFFGFCGIHRFYTGHIFIGIIQFVTGGLCGIWQFIDIIMIVTDNYRDSNGYKLRRD